MSKDSRIFLLTGDLGFGVLDKIRKDFPDRSINMGSCEQLMIGTAVGLAENGYIPVCYSITPFVLFRPYEMIRNYLNHDNINVKLLGTGRDRDYDGFSHWAEDDIDSLKHFKNIKLYKPKELTQDVFNDFMFKCGPSYLNVSRA